MTNKAEREIQVDAPIERVSSLVGEPEFFLSEHEGGTLLRVVESGLPHGEDEHDRVDGWGIELAAAKGRAEGVAV